jgi:hypothetical protein
MQIGMKIAIVECIDCVAKGRRLLTWIFNIIFFVSLITTFSGIMSMEGWLNNVPYGH